VRAVTKPRMAWPRISNATLNNEPVAACPPSNVYRLQKLIRRNKVAFAAGLSVVATLVIGISLATWMFFQEKAAFKRTLAAEREQTRLRQEADANAKKARIEAAKSQQVAQFLKSMLRAVGPEVARGRDTALLKEVLNSTAERVDKELKNQPEVNAELRSVIGRVYNDLHDFRKAEAMQREALRLLKSSGASGELLASALWELATTLTALDAREAESLARESLAIRREVFGNNDIKVAYSLDILAAALTHQGKLTEGEKLHRESLAMTAKAPGGNGRPQYFITLHNLGENLLRQGKFPEAELIVREALDHEKRGLEKDHPTMVDTLGLLGNALGGQRDPGKLAEAESTMREALRLEKKIYGEFSWNVGESLRTLANVLFDQGKLGEAESAFRERLSIYQKLGETNGMAVAILAVGSVLCSEGKFSESERCAREAVSLYRAIGDTEGVVHALVSLGDPLKRAGKTNETETVYREALSLDKDECSKQTMAIYNLMEMLEKQQRMIKEAPALLEQLPKDAKATRAWVVERWVTALMLKNNFAEAAATYVEQAALMRDDHLKARDFARIRCDVLARLRRWPEAAADFAQAIELNADDAGAWAALIGIQFQTGRLDACRKSLGNAIKHFNNATNAGAVLEIAKTGLSLPLSKTDAGTLAKMAEYGAAHLDLWNGVVTVLAEYRQNNFRAVTAALDKPEDEGEESERDLATYAVRAMAHHSLGEAGEARVDLSKAVELAEKNKIAKAKAGDLGINWMEWILAEALVGEAQSLLGEMDQGE
jgi:tetratricopeptide (TPR) repeat protein